MLVSRIAQSGQYLALSRLAIAKIADSQQIIAFNKLFVLHYSIN